MENSTATIQQQLRIRWRLPLCRTAKQKLLRYTYSIPAEQRISAYINFSETAQYLLDY
jgi:hypothetical protein